MQAASDPTNNIGRNLVTMGFVRHFVPAARVNVKRYVAVPCLAIFHMTEHCAMYDSILWPRIISTVRSVRVTRSRVATLGVMRAVSGTVVSEQNLNRSTKDQDNRKTDENKKGHRVRPLFLCVKNVAIVDNRPLGELLQVLIELVGARPAGDHRC